MVISKGGAETIGEKGMPIIVEPDSPQKRGKTVRFMSEVDAGSLLHDSVYQRSRGFSKVATILDKLEENKANVAGDPGVIDSGGQSKIDKYEQIIRESRKLVQEFERSTDPAAIGMTKSNI